MIDYVESYNSLVVRSHNHGGEMIVNLITTATQGGPSSPSDVHHMTYTRETTDIETNDQNKMPPGDSSDSSGMLDTSLFTGQPLRCELNSAEPHNSSRGLVQEPSLSKRFSSPHVPNIQKATNPPSVGESQKVNLEPPITTTLRSVD
jgi:hypothetical protein